MMLVASLGAQMISGVGAAASAVGGAVSGATGAIGGMSGAAKVLGGVSTAFQAFSQFAGARADANQLDQQAYEERLMGQQEAVNAQNSVTQINRDFVNVSGQQRVAFASNGFDLGSGSVRAARNQSLDEANRQIGQTLTNSDINSRQRKLREKSLHKAAKDRRKAGLFNVIGQFAGFGAGLVAKKAAK